MCFAAAAAGISFAKAELPKDVLQMKPFVSTSKNAFAMKNEAVVTMNAYSKAQAFRNAGYLPLSDWLVDPKAAVKNTKPDADVSSLKSVKLSYEWGKESSAIFRTKVKVPETVNGFIVKGPLAIAANGSTSIDVYVDGKRIKTFSKSGEAELPADVKPGQEIVIALKVTDMTQRGSLNSVSFHAPEIDALGKPSEEILKKLESARVIFDQLPFKQKDLLEAVTKVSKELDALRAAKDVAQAKSSLEQMLSLLAPVDKLLESYPLFNQGPYLQNAKQNEMTIMWETRVPSPSAVYYGKGEITEAVSDPTPTLYHKIVIKGLDPQTEYKYIAVSNKQASPESYFRTSIKRDTPFKFAFISDTQSNPQVSEPLIDMIIERKPNLLLSTGDETGNGSEYDSWAREFFRPLRRLIINTPLFVAIGNHEYSGIGCGNPQPWFERFESIPNDGHKGYYYAFTYGDARFIMLNSQESIGCNDVVPGTAQFDWLLKELDSEEFKKADFHFIFMHKPPYSQTWSGGYYDGEPSLREYLVPLLEKYKIDIIFSGHTHTYERGQWPRPGGTYYIIAGGAGGGLDDTKYKDWEQMQMYKFVHHFVFVQIDGKKLKFEAVDDKGKTIDSFEIDKSK